MTILARVNTFGNIYRLTSFGESHGPGIGGVIDGCPAGIELDTAFIQSELNRRKPGQSKITTPRKEDDEVQFLSGIYEGKTTGTPIGFVIWNKNQHSADYDNMKNVYRPSHADYTYQTKYGIRDPRGGGRSSARETIARCVAGAIAKLVLRQKGIRIQAFTSQVGNIKLNGSYTDYDLDKAEETGRTLSGSGDRRKNGGFDRRSEIQRRYDRRHHHLRSTGSSHWSGRTGIRKVACGIGTCDVDNQCRKRFRIR